MRITFPKNSILKVLIDHLKCLETHLPIYFPSNVDAEKENWVHKPYSIEMINASHLPLNAQEEFAELLSDTDLKLVFQKNC